MPSRESRATTTFVVSAVFALVILFIASAALGEFPLLLWTVLLMIGSLLATAVGLNGGAGWARAITTTMLQILLVTGVISSLLAIIQSRIEIPIGAILAIWALNSPFATPLGEEDVAGGNGTAALAAMLIGSIAPYFFGAVR